MTATRILIVEDDPEMRHLVTAVLQEDDREVVAVSTAGDARSVLAREAFDLIVLDLILPDVDGRTLLSELREAPTTASAQVIVLSARTGPETKHECYSLGADAFVEKPFDPERTWLPLEERIAKETDPRCKQAPVPEPGPDAATEAPAPLP